MTNIKRISFNEMFKRLHKTDHSLETKLRKLQIESNEAFARNGGKTPEQVQEVIDKNMEHSFKTMA